MLTHASAGDTQTLKDRSDSVSCGGHCSFPWVLVCTRFVCAFRVFLVGMRFDSKWLCISYSLVGASPLPLDMGYLFLVGSNIFLSKFVQQQVEILMFCRRRSAHTLLLCRHVRHIYFHSYVKSGPLSLSSLLPALYLSLESLLELPSPGPNLLCRQKLARQGLVWSSSRLPDHALWVGQICVGFCQHPEFTLCVIRLVGTSLGSPSLLSAPQGLCAPVCGQQEMARVNIDILGIIELKWTGMGEFNSDDHYIYYCGQESLRRNEVVSEIIWNAVLGCKLKNDRMIFVHFQGKPLNITVIQVYAPITNAKEAKVEPFYEDLQDLLELTHKRRCCFHHRGLECKSKRLRDTWSNRQVWPWSTKWSKAKAKRVFLRERTGHKKHPLPTTQETTLHMDITRWSILKSDWL